MCGIVGIVNFNSQNLVNENIVKKMNNRIYHRGPDDEGYFIERNVGLGIRRLSIIDLVSGHQPVYNEDRTIWVIFNGEIYNYLDLRAVLEKKGHKFYTKTDTEVIVHLYEEEEEECVNKFNGMFAFAIWDRRKKKLLLARDRLGIKPLHYRIDNTSLIFASELKALIEHPAVIREIDLESLNKYLTYEYIPAPNTIFRGIKKLLPGHILILKEGKISLKQYWNIELGTMEKSLYDKKKCIQRLKQLLEESVRKRLISDVPLGIFLSGGIDSSTITYFASKFNPSKTKTFNIGFEEKSFDESSYAKDIANLLGTKHYEELFTTERLLELVPKIADIIDEPLGDASFIPTYLVSQFARQYVTVILGGDGGDELFAGYPTYQAHKLASIYRKVPYLLRKGIEKIIQKIPPSDKNFSFEFEIKKFISGIEFNQELRNYIWLGSFSPQDKETLFRQGIKEEIHKDCFKEIGMHLKNKKFIAPLDKILYLDMKFYLQDNLLVKIDRASMANSLEVRVPYLDHKFVEFVTALPARFKLRGLTTKYIFKKSMKNILPAKIINRRKKGFGIPLAKWFKKELKDLLEDSLSKGKIDKEGIFDYNYIRMIMDEHFKSKKNNRKKLWTLLIFQLWYDKYIKKKN